MDTRTTRRYLLPGLLVAIAALAACNGSSDNMATLNLAVADTPVDGAESVIVTFTGVEIQGSGGAAVDYDFSRPKQIDLLQQQGGDSASLLQGVSLQAGKYEWIRLKVDASQSSITLPDGSQHPLTIPSGSQTGLKLVSGFTVAAGNVADFTIDFDLRKAVTLASGSYILRPAYRLIDNQQVGKISGSVANTVIIGGTAINNPGCMPAAYIYNGSDVSPTDVNATSMVQPVETATLSLDNSSGDYVYTAAFLAPGAYTVTVTCAAADDPTVVDTLAFLTPKNATVTADATTKVDFP